MGAFIGAVYSVPMDELRTLPGSRIRKPARMIARDFIGRDNIDEIFGDMFGPPNTLYAAVQQILNGEPLLPDRGGLYGYAVEGLCWAVGTTFFLPLGFPGEKQVDEFLAANGSPARLEQLLFSGFPLAIPEPQGYPMAGVWSPEQVVAMSEFLPCLPTVEDSLAVAVTELRRWVAEAVKHETDGLVGFWY